jgi:hypothetical protein
MLSMTKAGALAVLVLLARVGAQTPAGTHPIPLRNDVPRAGREILVLRNHELKKGAHERFYDLSRGDYWPFFERLGARVVGQWKVIGAGAPDDIYRLVRYASFEHWQGTRQGPDVRLGGNGPAREKGQQALGDRGGLQTGSKGAYFLEGMMAPGGPYFMPGLDESYDLVQAGQRPVATEAAIPVRAGAEQPGRDIVELRYQRIRKGGFDRFAEDTRSRIWPWEEKLGARPIGQWKVIYPAVPSRTAESPDYDEVITMTRYASEDHRHAMRPEEAVFMGGNGPDWRAWRTALDAQRAAVLDTRIELMEGHIFQSPPVYLPGLPERYRPTQGPREH